MDSRMKMGELVSKKDEWIPVLQSTNCKHGSSLFGQQHLQRATLDQQRLQSVLFGILYERARTV